MDYEAMFPGRFLKAADLAGREVTLTVERIEMSDLEEDDGEKKQRGIMRFVGKKKGLLMGRTNGEACRAMWGRDMDGWAGKRVTIGPDVVKEKGQFFGEPCIRVHGSPDLDGPVSFELRLKKRKPRMVTLTKTPARNEAPTQPAPASRSPGDMNAPPPDVSAGGGAF